MSSTTTEPTSSTLNPSHDEQIALELESAQRELSWLVKNLPNTIESFRAGLLECLQLISPTEAGSTLALSSPRSEILKGTITRVGTRIEKSNITLKLPSSSTPYKLTLLPPTPDSPHTHPFVLSQLTDVQNHLTACLSLLPPPPTTNPESQAPLQPWSDPIQTHETLLLLKSNLESAHANLVGGRGPGRGFPYEAVDARVFTPPLPENIVLDAWINQAAITVDIRNIERLPHSAVSAQFPPSMPERTDTPPTGPETRFGFGGRLAAVLSGATGINVTGGGARRGSTSDGGEGAVKFRNERVRVKERVCVDSQDPCLMAVMAKLMALGHNVGLMIRALEVVEGAVGLV
ncbi:hypothetical protein BJ508DRAFT_413727 [Ascobolus immersus RN42]|uniref:RAVE subunit 2/Rogdi n=1 Tax=Ascobolus immersus RN42 TaxID=1160509 RepID=A0A3N4IFV7_ASCIM|nr:hypothetical protein BJ508DRAFT_413727 [Ascobolus immersus RN42]